jgi:UDP-2,4-diacetamido-2,4,6-trideoxy-beta-L-altropyranose hydrolase
LTESRIFQKSIHTFSKKRFDKINNIIFRCDASAITGTGHVIRSMALAHELKSQCQRISFICKDTLGSLAGKIRLCGFDLHLLPESCDISEDLSSTLSIAKANNAQGIVIDNYAIDDEYMIALRESGIVVAAIDDIAGHPFSVDVLINQNTNANELFYETCPDTIRLLGLDYTLLRPEFIKARQSLKRESGEVENILITMGGGDLYGLTIKAIKAVEAIENEFTTTIVIGALTPDMDIIKDYVSGTEKKMDLVINASPKQMTEMMIKADLAVHTAGSTFWELFCLGVPSISIVVADNQEEIAEILSKLDVTDYLGWYNTLKEKDITYSIETLIEDVDKRKTVSKTMMGLVDGQGAKRVAKALTERIREST